MNNVTEKIFVDLIRSELGLPADQVFVSNQNANIKADKRLYVAVGLIDAQVMSNTSQLVPSSNIEENNNFVFTDGDNFVFTNGDNFVFTDNESVYMLQQVQMRENIQIDILSSDTQALLRKHEIIWAIQSIYSQQLQEENQFKIFEIPVSFVNTSSAEGGSQINRYSITISCFTWYKKITNYNALCNNALFDNFETRVDDEVTIGSDEGLIEFTIGAN